MKRWILVIALLLGVTALAAQSEYSYRYGKVYRWGNALTKNEALCMMSEPLARDYVVGRNLFISGEVFTYTGCAVGAIGGICVAASLLSDNVADNILGFTLSTSVGIAGAVIAAIGIPLMVTGAVKVKKVGQQMPEPLCSVGFGCTGSGVGMKLIF